MTGEGGRESESVDLSGQAAVTGRAGLVPASMTDGTRLMLAGPRVGEFPPKRENTESCII